MLHLQMLLHHKYNSHNINRIAIQTYITIYTCTYTTILSLNTQGHCLKCTHLLSANIAAAAYSMTYNWYTTTRLCSQINRGIYTYTRHIVIYYCLY